MIDCVDASETPARTAFGQFEQRRELDHGRVDLKCGDPRLRQFAMAVFDQRAATQADHHDVRRLGLQQPEAEHLAQIRQDQFLRVAQAHLALGITQAEAEAAVFGVFDHGRPQVAATA